MARSAYASYQTTIGLALEAVRNTATAPAFWEKVKGPKYKPDLTLLADDTLQGSAVKVYDLVPGLRYDSHGWDGYLYGDSFAILACCELGSVDNVTVAPANTTLSSSAVAGAATIHTAGTIAIGSWISISSGAGRVEAHLTTGLTGSTGPYTVTLQYPLHFAQDSGATVTGLTGHTFSLLNNGASPGNQPPSLSICDFDGEQWRQLTGAQLDKLTVKAAANALADYSATFFGNPSITPSPLPTASFTAVDPIPAWASDLSIGGTQATYLASIEYDLARGVKPIPALMGTTAYYEYFADAIEAAGKLTIIEQNGSPQLAQFLNYTKQALDFTTFDVYTGYAVNIHSSKSQFKTGELDRSKAWVEVNLDFQLLPTATDALAGGVSPLTITVANATTTPYLS